jgi:hypothetical protein
LPHLGAFDVMPVAAAASVEGQEAAAILPLVQAAYASAGTYRDEGWIQNVRVEGEDREVHSVEHFRVALARPDQLVWQWRDHKASRSSEDEFVHLLQRGAEVQFDSSDWGKGSLKERQEAFSRISAWEFRHLLKLLFPGELIGRGWIELLAEPRVVGVERVDGSDCFRIEGTSSSPATETPALYVLWVDRDSHHLRRVFERVNFGDWIHESTLLFSPAAGVDVAEAELSLDPSF